MYFRGLKSIREALIIPANENIFRVCARIIAVRQGRIDRSVLVAVRKVKPDAALWQKDRADAENVFVRGYNCLCGMKCKAHGAHELRHI